MAVRRANHYRVKDVAAILEVDPETVRRWIWDGKLDAWMAGKGTKAGYRVDHDALERYIRSRCGPYVKLDLPEE